ncbi:hypothetical protein DL98DRAFT_171781 [Cadophora sp. DSE1049]|nr:hypothetical protein DL98DRAFT_171781 [Cadophora sp. DSE1049]
MSFEDEIYVTSRSRAPSLIDVTSQNERVFAELPDLIQEAAVSTEFSSQRLRISRVQDGTIDTNFMTEPMFFITSRTDSGIDIPDLDVNDEKFLGKYGSDLTANFADIRVYGSKAFVQKRNISNGSLYSISTCATGYIWVSTTLIYEAIDQAELSDIEIQIGTFALKARAITTVEIPCRYRYSGRDDPLDGQLSLLCSTVLAKYLRLRMIGAQYEEAAESAIKQSRIELSPLRIVDPGKFDNLELLLRQVCTNAPMPPHSVVSLISRSMITRRWQCWRDSSILRKRYNFPQRIIRCFQRSRHDSIDLLSGCFKALAPENKRAPVLCT